MKVVINDRYGGFSLSETARKMYCKLKGINSNSLYYFDIQRNDPILVSIVEQLGELANGEYAHLKIVDIPEDISWFIHEYDGMEYVAESHRTWS